MRCARILMLRWKGCARNGGKVPSSGAKTLVQDSGVDFFDACGSSQFKSIIALSEKGTVQTFTKLRVQSYQTLAASSSQQFRDLCELNIEFTLENGVKIPKNGVDIALLDLGRSGVVPSGLPPLDGITRYWSTEEEDAAIGLGVDCRYLSGKMLCSGLFGRPAKALDVTTGILNEYQYLCGTVTESQVGGPVVLPPASNALTAAELVSNSITNTGAEIDMPRGTRTCPFGYFKCICKGR
eukprot:jgi/Botrbrau1/23194/Bobra.0041s0041.1